jgi:hypothetical protein
MLKTSLPLGGRSKQFSFMYLHTIQKTLLDRINVCDLPEMYDSLKVTYEGNDI